MRSKSFIAVTLMAFTTASAWADETATFTIPVLLPEVALEAAQAALNDCRERGAQVAVAVVDRGGNPQVMLRDQFAGPHTPDTAIGKAWTAVSFRTNTTELTAMTQVGEAASGIRDLPRVVVLGGGVMIEQAGSLVGGIGVSGAPSGEMDDACAEAGIEQIRFKLAM